MNFEEALADLIDKHLEREGYEGIISALELSVMSMKEQEAAAISELADD
jgi:hypothetical protein